jgi:hypothetical protein
VRERKKERVKEDIERKRESEMSGAIFFSVVCTYIRMGTA